MDRTERVEIRLSPNEMEEIDSYIEEGNFPDRSRMFRSLAKREIRGEDNTTIDAGQIIDAVEIAVSDISETMEEMNDRLADVEQRLEESDSTDKLARDLYKELPIVGSSQAMRDMTPGLAMPTEEPRVISTPQAWAKYFDENIVEVRRALSRALEYYPDVQYITTDEGHRRYYIIDRSLDEDEITGVDDTEVNE